MNKDGRICLIIVIFAISTITIRRDLTSFYLFSVSATEITFHQPRLYDSPWNYSASDPGLRWIHTSNTTTTLLPTWIYLRTCDGSTEVNLCPWTLLSFLHSSGSQIMRLLQGKMNYTIQTVPLCPSFIVDVFSKNMKCSLMHVSQSLLEHILKHSFVYSSSAVQERPWRTGWIQTRQR